MDWGFIFDLDGVITETSEFHYLAWKKLADEEGLPFTREDNEALRGVSRRRSLEILLKGKVYPESSMQDFMERKNAYYLGFLDEITPAHLLPGVGDFLQAAKGEGIALGLASASKNARVVCERLQIMGLLGAFGDGYCVINPKPAPDIFIWAAGRLNLPATRCTVFEDAEAGVEGAINGGFHVVGIGLQDRIGKAHQVIQSFEGVEPLDFVTGEKG